MIDPCEKCKKKGKCHHYAGVPILDIKPCYPRLDYLRGLQKKQKKGGVNHG